MDTFYCQKTGFPGSCLDDIETDAIFHSPWWYNFKIETGTPIFYYDLIGTGHRQCEDTYLVRLEVGGSFGPKSIFCRRTINGIMGVDSVLVDKSYM